MCLSPEVDVIAASAITIVAVDALRHNQNLRSLPIALLPAVFAIHTFSDAFVWWGAQGKVSNGVADISAWIYLFIAFTLLPIFVPIATYLLEPKGWRRNLLAIIIFGGVLTGVDSLISINDRISTVEACNLYVDYHVGGTSALAGTFYMIATIGAMLISGQKYLFKWGVVNLVVVIALGIWASQKLPSLWCFWAAITSIFVAWFIREIKNDHEKGKAWPWRRREKISFDLV
ncbi:MAG: hypothetical protein RIS61_980 [Actinomycetota bacterium]|jgi:hypothetical protein